MPAGWEGPDDRGTDGDDAWRPDPPAAGGRAGGDGAGRLGDESVPGLSALTEIARGGDSIVYRAHQDGLSRDVAVKVLLVDDEQTVARFEREIALTVTLGRQHPNIVTILDTATTSRGRPCLIMDLVERGSLDDVLNAEGPLRVSDVLAVGTTVADALDFAHGQGVLHRDVKPQNILVLPTSYVLADFGIARFADSAHTASAERFSYRHASPQVLDGHPPTAADDVWSLGSTLHTLLDGRAPFASDDLADDTALAYLRRARTEPTRELARADLPDGLREIIARALAKDRADRPDAATLREELDRVRSSLLAWSPEQVENQAVEPVVAEPAIAGAPAVQPAVAEPAAVESSAVEPAAVEPSAAQPPPVTPTSAAPRVVSADDQWAPASAPAPATGAVTGPATGTGPAAADPVAADVDEAPAHAHSALSHLAAARPDAAATGLAPAHQASGEAPESLDLAPEEAGPTPGRWRRPVALAVIAVTIGAAVGVAYAMGSRDTTTPAPPAVSTQQSVPTLAGSPTVPVTPVPPVADPALTAIVVDMVARGSSIEIDWKDPTGGKASQFVVTQVSPTRSAVATLPGSATSAIIDGIPPGSGERCYVVLTIQGSQFGTSAQRCVTP